MAKRKDVNEEGEAVVSSAAEAPSDTPKAIQPETFISIRRADDIVYELWLLKNGEASIYARDAWPVISHLGHCLLQDIGSGKNV